MDSLEKIVLLKLNDKRDIFTTVPKGMKDEVKKKIGSQFAANGSRDTIRGLSYVQERVYLPAVLGIQASDGTFPIKSRDFWADYSLTPTVEGIPLNIATTLVKIPFKKMVNGVEEEIVEETEIPVNWEDYIAYNFAMKSSRVAKTKQDLESLEMYDFFLIDLSEEKAKQLSEFEISDKADGIYVRLTADSRWDSNVDRINWIIEILRDKKVVLNIDAMSPAEKKMMLSKFKSTIPSLFIAVCEKDNLETEALISRCVSNLILVKQNNEHFYDNEAIGNEDAAVRWFKNPVNSAKVLLIRAKLEDILKQKRQ